MASETGRVATAYLDIAEFRRAGYLQEVNRRFLHPLGLALAVWVNGDGTETLGGVIDNREDPEGICYEAGAIDPDYIMRIDDEFNVKANARRDRFGWVIQPPND